MTTTWHVDINAEYFANGFLEALWGFDIFFGPAPFMKTVVIVNLIMWVLLWVTK